MEQKITADKLKELQGLRDSMKKVQELIGALEIQKTKLTYNYANFNQKLEDIAKESLLQAGATKENANQFRINLETGEINLNPTQQSASTSEIQS